MVAEHLIALNYSGRKKHKSDNANMSNQKFCKSEPPKSQGFQYTEKHCWVISIPKTQADAGVDGQFYVDLLEKVARNKVEIDYCTKSDTSEMVENTKAITEGLLRNSTKCHRTFARR